MEKPANCSCGASHQGHICVLKSKGLASEVDHLTSAPTVSCFTCGVEANNGNNVCNPVTLDS